MNCRTIRRHIAALRQHRVSLWSRRAGLGILMSSVLGFSAVAQSTTDFLDPLNDERVRIERGVDGSQPSSSDRQQPARADTAQEANSASLLSRARLGASSGAEAAQERATGFWAGMKASIAGLAAKMGLPTAGLLGLLGLALVALALLVGWTLFRGNKGKGRRRVKADDDIYAGSARNLSARRQPGDSRRASSPAKAAPVAFKETMPDDFDAIFAEESEDSAFEDDRDKPVAAAEPPAKPMDKSNTSTWRKPNLDRLRDSIKADWTAEKERDDDAYIPKPAPKKAAAAPLAAPASDPGERRLTDVSDGWEDWDAQDKPEDDPWGESQVPDAPANDTDDSAMRRIRALRESLRAS